MKCISFLIILIFSFSSCKTDRKPIVTEIFIDSVLTNYTIPVSVKNNEADIQFWEQRISSQTPDYSNKMNYAAALVTRFHLLGNIQDLKKSDSILQTLFADYNEKEVGPIFSLVSHSILQHRFKEADSLLNMAKLMGLKRYNAEASSFDVNFELGNIWLANVNLRNLQSENDFGYQFRKSKMMHYNGNLDSSIIAMQKAFENSGQKEGLKFASLSNLGDLYIHAGKMEKAYQCFETCIKDNPADMHSLIGMGWIALVKDKNEKLAENIFKFVASKSFSPEALYKMILAAEQKKDTLTQIKYANKFADIVSDPIYGNMYHKYLIQLYTGILQSPDKAELIASKELQNRATPQTYAWYVWTLVCNNKKEEAYQVYTKHVSGKPLEGLELYWMGKLMQSLNKKYNAKQFFDAATLNIYDLTPSITNELLILSK